MVAQKIIEANSIFNGSVTVASGGTGSGSFTNDSTNYAIRKNGTVGDDTNIVGLGNRYADRFDDYDESLS